MLTEYDADKVKTLVYMTGYPGTNVGDFLAARVHYIGGDLVGHSRESMIRPDATSGLDGVEDSWRYP